MDKNFGNILRNKREDLGYSTSDVSEKTKIREEFIKAIEEYRRLEIPESYFDLFVKKYADFLEISLPEDKKKKKESDHILELLQEKQDNKKKKNHFSSGLRKSLLFIYMHRKTFAFVVIFIFLFLFSRHIFQILNEGEKNQKSESIVKIITIEGDPDDKISVDIRDSIMIDEDKPELFSIYISAQDSCYICYYADTLNVKETILLPGRSLSLKAARIIEAKLGNSKAVTVHHNDNRVLKELRNFKNSSSIIRINHSGAERIRRSEKISEFLKNTYGLE